MNPTLSHRVIISIFPPLILLMFISLFGLLVFFTFIIYQEQDYSFLNLNKIILPLEISLNSNPVLKSQLSIQLTRDNLNDLRIAVVNGKPTDEIIKKINQNLTDDYNFITKSEESFKNNKTNTNSSEMLNMLIDFKNIVVSYDELINGLKTKNMKKINKQNLIFFSLIKNAIYDLDDDGKLNSSAIEAFKLSLFGTIQKNDGQMALEVNDLSIPIDVLSNLNEKFIGKEVEIFGVLKTDPQSLIVEDIKTVSLKKQNKDFKGKGLIKNFGRKYIFTLRNSNKPYLLSSVPWDIEDYLEEEIVISGSLQKSVFDISKIN